MDKMFICTAQLVKKKNHANNSWQEQMIRNASASLAVISLMFPVQKNTTTRPTHHRQKPNKHCWKMLDVALHQDKLAELVQTTYSTCGAIFSYPTSKHDYKVAIHDNQCHHNREDEYQISHLKIL